MLSWSRVQQKHPDEKSAGDFQSWESNRGQQWLSRTDQIKIWQGFCLGQNFDSFSREKIRPFWSPKWLQKTYLGFHKHRIKFAQESTSGIVKNGINGTRHEKRNNAIASLVVIIKTWNYYQNFSHVPFYKVWNFYLVWTLQSKVDFPDNIPTHNPWKIGT